MATEHLALAISAIVACGPYGARFPERPSDTKSVAVCPDHRSRWGEHVLD